MKTNYYEREDSPCAYKNNRRMLQNNTQDIKNVLTIAKSEKEK